MAKHNSKVLIGYDDELISDKYKEQVNFTVNKIGGQPEWPKTCQPDPPITCPLCELPRPLIVQIYVPIENNPHHRILYLFACINPNCWNSNESWLCVRVQTMEPINETNATTPTLVNNKSSSLTTTGWCDMENDWDDDDDDDQTNANVTEENGNVISDNKMSDEDESCSIEDSLRSNFGSLTVGGDDDDDDDERNANNGAYGGAAGRQDSPQATAEIEGDEGEVITIDSPTMPQINISALLQEAAPLPEELCRNYRRNNTLLEFEPYFIAVNEEILGNNAVISDRHVKELIAEYQKNDNFTEDKISAAAERDAVEKYEKSRPAHGDKMFHNFLARIQANPGQILRYSWDDEPLLLQPLCEQPPAKKCFYCQSNMVFEFQLLSTVISKLKLFSDVKLCSRLDFGTVLIYTCKQSCWSTDATFKLETVVVQKE